MSAGKVVSAEFIRSAHRSEDFLRDGRPQLLLAGRSNVGKSSLLNRLLGKKGLARVSSTPGRTRAVNYFLVNGRFYLVDLPGYGYARAGREERREWAELVDGFVREALPRAGVILLVDAKVGATSKDSAAYQYLESLGAPITVVATKIDQVPRSKRQAALAAIRRSLELDENRELMAVSAVSGEGLKQLWSEIGLQLETSAR